MQDVAGGSMAFVAPKADGPVMIVDDNLSDRTLLEKTLLRTGHEVCSFELGRLALAAAARRQPDLILVDIYMPEMNGYEFCQSLKSTEGLSQIPVIFLSVLDDHESKLKAFESGAVDYISKPFHLEEVNARVATHLKIHRLQRASSDENERLE